MMRRAIVDQKPDRWELAEKSTHLNPKLKEVIQNAKIYNYIGAAAFLCVAIGCASVFYYQMSGKIPALDGAAAVAGSLISTAVISFIFASYITGKTFLTRYEIAADRVTPGNPYLNSLEQN